MNSAETHSIGNSQRLGVKIPTPERLAGGNVLRVAIVADDADEAALFGQWLRLAGHRCQRFPDGAALIRSLDQVGLDALLVDGSFPSTLEMVRRIRGGDRAALPVLLVSGRGREDDVVNALRLGADDYLVKPVRQLELVARLEAIARRGKHRTEGQAAIEAGSLRVDWATRTVWREGRPLNVTAKDFELAAIFLRNIGRLLSRGYLLDSVWGPNTHVLSRTLDTHVSRLRKKLGLVPEHGWRLMPVYTRGYRLEHIAASQATALQAERVAMRSSFVNTPMHAESGASVFGDVITDQPRIQPVGRVDSAVSS